MTGAGFVQSQMSDDLSQHNDKTSQAVAPTQQRRPSNFWLIIVASLFIIVPFLTWYFTWFGRSLTDEKIVEYLADEKKPRNIQHALTQIEQRIEKGDPTARKFYPRILELAKSPTGEVRKTVAWVMGQDNTSEEFHRALLSLLGDSEPLVRRNAALQLVRFGDASGRPELRAMLQPFEAKSPIAGTIVSILPVGSELRAGALLARIRAASGSVTNAAPAQAQPGDVQEFRAPVDGEITSLAVKEGASVTADQPIASLKPDEASVRASLRALAYVGAEDDLPVVEQYASSSNTEIQAAAAAAAKSIRSRAS
jgi:HEAT repeat protein